MSRAIVLNGEAEIIAAIYDPENDPTSLICLQEPEPDEDGHPYCLHSLREGTLQEFNKMLERARKVQGLKSTERPQAWLLKNFRHYPEQEHVCHGCHFFESIPDRHRIRESVTACTKQFDACA